MPERAALIAVLIVGRPLCADCIAVRGNISPYDLGDHLQRCRVCTRSTSSATAAAPCGVVGEVYSLQQDAL